MRTTDQDVRGHGFAYPDELKLATVGRLLPSRHTLVVLGATLLLGIFLAPVAQADPAPRRSSLPAAPSIADYQSTANIEPGPSIADYQSTANIEPGPSIADYQSTANIEPGPSIADYQSTANVEPLDIAKHQNTANVEPAPSIPSSGFQYWWIVAFSVMAILLLAGAGTVIMVFRNHQTHPVG
jgi:hypothetical protein